MTTLDLDRVRENAQKADTDDLLNRVTVYRDGMEPEAIDIIEAELRERGVSAAQVVDYAEGLGDVLTDRRNLARECTKCRAPAVVRAWRWHRWWGIVPVFPRLVYLCRDHG